MKTDKIELLYIWIGKYKKLRSVGFNLSNKYQVFYDSKSNKLQIEENQRYIEGFFNWDASDRDTNHGYITNLKTVVGKNSVGKTTLLNFLQEVLGVKYEDTNSYEFFYIRLRNNKELFIDGNPKTDVIKQNLSYPESLVLSHKMLNRDELVMIYHSNVFAPLLSYHVSDDDNNLSVSHLLHKSSSSDELLNDLKYVNVMSSFIDNEFRKQVKFLYTYRNNQPFALPNYLGIQLLNKPLDALRGYMKQRNTAPPLLEKNMDLLESIISIYESQVKEYDNFSRSKFIYELTIRGIISTILNYSRNNQNVIAGSEVPKIILEEIEIITNVLYEYVTLLHEWLNQKAEVRNFITTLKKSNFCSNEMYSSLIDKSDHIVNLGTMLADIINSTDSIYPGYVSIDISKISSNEKMDDILRSLTFNYFADVDHYDYISMWMSHVKDEITPLSSGENALLSLYSRLHWWWFDLSSSSKNASVCLLLDEVDLMLHPQWQTEFLERLTKFIEMSFKGFFVQIILTTHSPLILSDLPGYCVIRMNDSDGQIGVITVSENKDNTFGSNISKLFNDEFILQSLIGEFAKKKINTILSKLHGKRKLQKKDTVEIEAVIPIIGEPFIKEKIRQTYEWKKVKDNNKR